MMIYFVKSASHPKTVQQENDSARDDKPEEEQPEGVVAPVALFVIRRGGDLGQFLFVRHVVAAPFGKDTSLLEEHQTRIRAYDFFQEFA